MHAALRQPVRTRSETRCDSEFDIPDVLHERRPQAVARLATGQRRVAPHEASWHIVLKQSDLQLRRYGQQVETAGPVLIVPAPIKRPTYSISCRR